MSDGKTRGYERYWGAVAACRWMLCGGYGVKPGDVVRGVFL